MKGRYRVKAWRVPDEDGMPRPSRTSILELVHSYLYSAPSSIRFLDR